MTFSPLEKLNQILGDTAKQFEFYFLPSCDSTNTQLAAQPTAQNRLGVLFTEYQHAGRGRRGRSWMAWGENSLTFSVAWCFKPSPRVPQALSLVVGLALVRACHALGATSAQLKWPNDILIGGAKLAGTLIELSPTPGDDLGTKRQRAIIGIGVNLNPPAEDVGQPSTGLWPHTSISITRLEVFATFLQHLAEILPTYAETGFPSLRREWMAHHAFQGMPVSIRDDHQISSGVCLGVNEGGALLLETPNGPKLIVSGDVSVRAAT